MLHIRYGLRTAAIRPTIWSRFKSNTPNPKSPKKTGENGEKTDEIPHDSPNSLASRQPQDLASTKPNNFTSPASPAPLNNDQITKFMKKNNKPYIPKLKHERVTYEYPGLPNQDDFTKQARDSTKKPINRYTRYIPHMLTAVVVVWAGYTVKVWFFPGEQGSNSKDLLSPEEFHPFVVTHKEEIDKDHFLVELTPKFDYWQYSFSPEKSLWNGDRIWSVEVKQPQIMVVRSYTPLPLYFMKSEYTWSGEKKPLLKVITPDAGSYDHGGVMTLYIKRYDDGEVSRYIVDRKIGEEIELRGPHTEYKFPFHPLQKLHERPTFMDIPSRVPPELYLEKIKLANKLPDYDNLTFYGGGTGIAPILQVLMSRNPYRGFVTVHYSARKSGEIKALERMMFFLEKLDRAKFITHYDDEKSYLNKKDILLPQPSNYVSPAKKEQKIQNLSELSPKEALELRKGILEGDGQEKEDSELEKKIEEWEKNMVRYNSAIQQARYTSKEPKKPSSLSLVCGPDGYINYVAGPVNKITGEQGSVSGLLGQKGWDNDNTFKLSN